MGFVGEASVADDFEDYTASTWPGEEKATTAASPLPLRFVVGFLKRTFLYFFIGSSAISFPTLTGREKQTGLWMDGRLASRRYSPWRAAPTLLIIGRQQFGDHQ